MIEKLTIMAYGIVAFAVIIIVGSVLLSRLGSSVASCPAGFTYYITNTSSITDTCCNTTAVNCVGVNASTSYGQATTNAVYFLGQIGSSGLAGWVPAVIAFFIGMLFLGYFMLRKGAKQ